MALSISAKPRSFHELVDAYFDDYFRANPSQATSVGFHQLDGQLEDFSLAARQQNRRRALEYLAAFEAINPRTLSSLDRDDREIMIATLHSMLLDEDRIQMWRKNPDAYSGIVTGAIFELIKRHGARAVVDGAAHAVSLRQLPRQVVRRHCPRLVGSTLQFADQGSAGRQVCTRPASRGEPPSWRSRRSTR
jgi:uncharacterized protein (DUF885 family)